METAAWRDARLERAPQVCDTLEIGGASVKCAARREENCHEKNGQACIIAVLS